MLTDYPCFGEQPQHFRYEIIRDYGNMLCVWDNDECIIVPGTRYPYERKIMTHRAMRRLDATDK
jgi:hypothetical protein